MRLFRRILARIQRKSLLPPGIVIEKGVWIGGGALLDWSHGRHITIREDATIVGGARLLCHDASSGRRNGLTWVAPVTIGKRAFIGADSIIMPGVTVGDDAIVAAGAVVLHDVAPGEIVGGIPARTIGSVAELDSRRAASIKQGTPIFLEPEYNREDLTAEKAAELHCAAKQGGYYLVSPEVFCELMKKNE